MIHNFGSNFPKYKIFQTICIILGHFLSSKQAFGISPILHKWYIILGQFLFWKQVVGTQQCSTMQLHDLQWLVALVFAMYCNKEKFGKKSYRFKYLSKTQFLWGQYLSRKRIIPFWNYHPEMDQSMQNYKQSSMSPILLPDICKYRKFIYESLLVTSYWWGTHNVIWYQIDDDCPNDIKLTTIAQIIWVIASKKQVLFEMSATCMCWTNTAHDCVFCVQHTAVVCVCIHVCMSFYVCNSKLRKYHMIRLDTCTDTHQLVHVCVCILVSQKSWRIWYVNQMTCFKLITDKTSLYGLSKRW